MEQNHFNATHVNTFKVARKALIDNDLTFVAVARKAGVSRSYLWRVLENRVPGRRVRPKIAEILGMRVEELWPNEGRK